MAGRPPTFALPTEPLLEQPTSALGRLAVPRDVLSWLDELSTESDVGTRARLLFATLRKNLDQPKAIEALTGILREAGLGHPRGVAALAAFLWVRAPGLDVVEMVRSFSHVQRMTLRHRRAQARGRTLDPEVVELLAAVEAIEGELKGMPPPAEQHGRKGDLPAIRHGRATIRRIMGDLQSRGTLSRDQIQRFVTLARLEERAAEQRATLLAQSIDPLSARRLSRIMPRLTAMDVQVRDLRSFLDRLEESGRSSLFLEQHPTMRDHLDASEIQRLRQRLREAPNLAPLHRALHLIDRNPLPGRTLGYFSETLLRIGAVLRAKHLRRDPLNPVEAVIIALEFAADGVLTLPASFQVRSAVDAEGPENVETSDIGLRFRLDEDAARALALPYGLPALEPEGNEAEDGTSEESAKDLVLSNMNRSSILLGLLKNPKVAQTPGVVSTVVRRCRDLGVLGYICDNRPLFTGVANRDVPEALLRSPMRVPVKTLRKFINVRYVPKNQLRRLATDRSNIRREVADEIALYLKSLA